MSDREGIFGAAKEAAGSAAEQVRAAAPGTYEAGADTVRYIRETASEHPMLVGAAVIAFVGGLITATVAGSGSGRRDWQTQSRDWRERGKEVADRARRSGAPNVSRAADDAGDYIAHSVRENPISGLLIAAAVGAIIMSILRPR
jgi:ElaB/YqjD/DUF883 family membrane-anchored ribosome-binding protein